MTYWTTSIKEVIQWFSFLNIGEYTADKICTEITLLPLLLEDHLLFQLSFWYHKENFGKKIVRTVAISCRNFGK